MDTVKLLIWDLDETFWKGTLSDGEITPIPENIELVKRLTDRGIVNSICSKNDYEKTKAKLEELGVWEYFVFPSIDWTPKGLRVKNIISDMNLRPVNCLFIDDNVNNLEEAKFAAGGGINVSLPDDLPELVKDPAFEGKDDSEHSRLKQYKILEEKAAARAQSGSNEEFLYQSEIHVELIEDCRDKLVRIYEMIHRNNQLNFTKDRISQEEVDKIFTDSEITSGVVHVTDKYGDHGIIGCYAVKDGKALQFVFSCRILGMGVEQWVYAELGYPDIEVVGEVAAELNKTDKPEWINNSIHTKIETSASIENTPKLIVYGNCPLRPVWAYLQPKLPLAKFAEIDPAPCPLNLAVMLRFSEEQQNEWMSKIETINNVYTFDKEVYSKDTDYILITLQGIENLKKYRSKTNGSYFYSMPINKENTDQSTIDDYEPCTISLEDIEIELSYICENLSKNTTLLLQTIPEVEFPTKGKDKAYYCSIEQNRIVQKIADKYSNAHIIDIRKYAKSSVDFFEPVYNHYNRNIGYYLAEEIFEYMGINSTENEKNDTYNKQIPDNAFVQEFDIPNTNDKCQVTTYIINGVFCAHISFTCPEKYMTQCIFIRNHRDFEFTSEISDQTDYEFNLIKAGCRRLKVIIYNSGSRTQIFEFFTNVINYTKYNYATFLDPRDCRYDSALVSMNEFIGKNIEADNYFNLFISHLSQLAALNINPFDYFVQRGINEISIFVDERMANVIAPYLSQSPIKIKYLFTNDNVLRLPSPMQSCTIKDINSQLPLAEKDTVLLAFDFGDVSNIINIFRSTHAKIILINTVLSGLLTKYLFVERFKTQVPKIIAVRTANLHRALSFNYSKLSSNEKVLDNNKFINEADILYKVNNNYESLPPQLKRIPKEQLIETMKVPRTFYDQNAKARKFIDMQGKYVNIKNGFRRTTGNSNSCVGTVYIFGGPHAFGYGVKDEETIASYLQNILNLPYKVQNYANCWNYDYTMALDLMETIEFQSNDIAVFIMSNWCNETSWRSFHWLQWEAIEDPIIKVDAFPLFEQKDRPDYFLHRNGFTPECNMKLAELIRDAIYKNIKLFAVQ